ncbi:alcohol dehydogenase [Trametes versicolor FP-101664 SS1]|uniref:alcohol dehydogenase n=1 Tax=Trametes versicolor (strain FP-101664) TaxID=717944 RepID=UPI00046228D0|nr:alcohol dehydogenase [Trametes versicolor FP-101664 SS1]EIW63293.1 alcohol dehydogenase [Trametes versicolor FP-101664 SS1]
MSTNTSVDVPASSETMIAYQIVPGLTEPQRKALPIPTPGPDEVLVKVLASGVCHSDVHLLEWSDGRPFTPFTHTLGHECAGTIVRLGSNVASDHTLSARLAVGTYAAVLATNACEKPDCDRCSRGLANVCFALPLYGLGGDGSWTQYIVARACTVVPVPGNDPKSARLSPAVVAAATDAVLTPWHALKRTAGVQPGQTVLIFGCGGLGMNAIQIAKNVLGAGVVIAVDVREESLSIVRKLGADYAIHPDGVKALLEEKGLKVDVAMDLVGKQSTLDGAVAAVRTGGTVVLIGLYGDALSVTPLAMTTKQLKLLGSFGGDYQDLEESLRAIAEGKVTPGVEERPMDQCREVLKDLAAGRIRTRVALVPN